MGVTSASLLADGVIDDPWLDGRPRFGAEPCRLSVATAGALATAACAAGAVLDAVVSAVARDPALATLLGLDSTLAAIARLDAPRWLVLARADVFRCDDRPDPQVCEINCDTPTGLAECTTTARLAAADHPDCRDPSAALGRRWVAAVAAGQSDPGRPLVVGFLDATEYTEDLGHVRLLTRWLEAAGMRVVRGAPWNLHRCPGDRVGLFGTPVDIIVRHYKTDWWAARRPSWTDEPMPADAAPLAEPLHAIAGAMQAGTVSVVNPWGAAIAQSKRAFALPWEMPQLFTPDTLALAHRFMPEGRFLEELGAERVIRERPDWVIKGAFGCEGDEVLLGRDTPAEQWAQAVHAAAPGRWLAQRAFSPHRDAAGRIANHGVFLVGGQPSGIYTRTSVGATGTDALAVPTLVHA